VREWALWIARRSTEGFPPRPKYKPFIWLSSLRLTHVVNYARFKGA